MNVIEKIEANADLTLWCVHVLGPDDVLAAPSYAAASAHARALNAALHGKEGAPDDILCFGYAAPWPHSPESHAEDVKNWEDVIRPKMDPDPHQPPTSLEDEVNALIARLSAPGRIYTHAHAAQIMQTLLSDHRIMRGMLAAGCSKLGEVEQHMATVEKPAKPSEEGHYWGKLVHPRKMPEGEDWASPDWEVVQVSDNGGEGDDKWRVYVPGIQPGQLLDGFVWGPRVPDFRGAS